MDKPSTIEYREFIQALRNLIAGTPLPAFVILQVLRDLTEQVSRLEEQQYQKDIAMWMASTNETSKPNGGTGT